MQEHPDTTDPRDDSMGAFALNRDRLPEKIFRLRQKLYRKAKQEPRFRFYALYDRIYRPDVLRAAWDRVAANNGAPGVDGVRIRDLRRDPTARDAMLTALHEELRGKSYRPQPVKRVYIPKPDGRQRPLGIPTVRDRVVQMAAKLILEPIFEADFEDCSYGFRPGRSAHDALGQVAENLRAGRREVYDADLQSYFDTIPHDNLLKCVERRVADRSVLCLIRLWLRSVVLEPGQGPDDPDRYSRSDQGTPQGGVISPLLANLYLHWLDKQFHSEQGPYAWANARLVRYADDFVILARYVDHRIRNWTESLLEGRFGLRINREKTRVVRLSEPGSSLDFLGFTFRYDGDLHGRPWTYLNIIPSKKALARERQKLREMTGPRMCFKPVMSMVREVNTHLHQWSRYYRHGYPKDAFRRIAAYARQRLIRHLRRRSQRPYRPPEGISWYSHLAKLGLVPL